MRHRDRLEADLASRREQPVESGEVRRPVRLPDRLDHLDADDRVERTLDLAVVLQAQVHPVGEPGRRDPLGSPAPAARVEMVTRGHLRASLRGPDGERPPAGADLQHAGCPARRRA